ncbi:MAG: ABC transporter permease [Bacteroidetes bacterium]|nr:ABC transporter permease [Bacteroidota bacterium]
MLRNYLRTAFRVISRHPGYASINIFGLSIGVAVSLLLLLFVSNELTFDGFHEGSDRTYRAWVLEDYGADQQFFNTTSPLPLGPTLQSGIPEIEHIARYNRISDVVRRGETEFRETLFMVDPAFFDVFDFQFIVGNPEGAFPNPESILLSESAAERYFGAQNPIGETIAIDFNDSPRDFRVTGILADVPKNSSLQFEFLLPWTVTEWYYPAGIHTAWFNVSPETYVQLRPGVDVASVEAKIPQVMAAALGDRVEPGQYRVGLQPLTGIHLDPDFPIGYAVISNPIYVRILLGVALLVLFIACINFVTLSLSRAATRTREIGVRKAVGAGKSQLVRQFFGEAVVFTGLAIGIGLITARILLPAFNALSQNDLELVFNGRLLATLFVLFATVSVFTGLYPALVLASYKPTEAFRGSVSSKGSRGILRKSLVTVQFGISSLLIAAVIVMQGQLRFIDTIDLGFSDENVIYIPTEFNAEDGFPIAERLRNEVASRTDIQSVAASMILFDPAGWGRIGYEATDGSYRRFFANVVDYDFISTMNLRVIAGRDFDRNQPSDLTSALIVNQAFVDAYGWENPLIEQLPGSFGPHEIIGVVDDFHYTSLHSSIEPAILALNQGLIFSGARDFDYQGSMSTKIIVKASGQNIQGTLNYLEKTWAVIAPGTPFSFEFVDQDIQSQYIQEDRLSTIIVLGTVLALLIAGLGLFGLAAISVVRRTKEVGIRKALGASAISIVGLFGREFSWLVVIALAFSVPVGYWGLQKWLGSFAFHTELGWMPFVVAGVCAFTLMWVAVGIQSLRAASLNPVLALRDN